jgi:hypothetical protein
MGQCVGECIGERLAREFAADAGRHSRPHSAGAISRTRNTTVGGDLESVADILGGQVESLSRTVAEHVERAEFIECEGFFAAAVAAVNCGFEQLEYAAQNRDQLTAAVDRFDAAVGGKVDEKGAKAIGAEVNVAQSRSNGSDYQVLWNYYRQGVKARSESELDYRVGRRAFADGVAQRDIALMLVVGSPTVRQIYHSYGKPQAMKYVNQIVTRMGQQRKLSAVKVTSKRQMELE